MTKFLSILTLAIILAQAPAQAQQKPKPYLFSSEIQKAVDSLKDPWELQEYAVALSRTGNYKKSLDIQKAFVEKNRARQNVPTPTPPDSAGFASFQPTAAIPAIIEEAAKYQVLITNEAHYQPQNRVFTTALLRSLYKLGYRYLLPESLYNTDTAWHSMPDTALNQRKYPTRINGYYIDEPRYGELIRTALRIGYTVLPYEHTAGEIKDPAERFMARERGQAENIATILKKDPSAKILVHCGYGHLNEHIRDSVGMMASMLTLYHHIDPLTIDQEYMLEEHHKAYYDWAHIKEPSVFKSGQSYFSDPTPLHQVDMVVFFPHTVYLHGRPNWLLYDTENKYIPIGEIPAGLHYPLMILAYHAGEDPDLATPADIIELQEPSETGETSLVLKKGTYTVTIKDQDGHRQQKTIPVK